LDIDHGEGLKIALGGYGITFLVLIALALLAWLSGFIIQNATRRSERRAAKQAEMIAAQSKSEEKSALPG